MATLVQISWQPSTVKTMGARFLNPETTLFIAGDPKGLPWAGWRKQYSPEKKNFVKVNTAAEAIRVLKAAVDKLPHVNCIVIDTISTLMSNEEMEIMKSPGSRDAWADLASSVYELYQVVDSLKKDDLVVFVLSHIELFDDNGIVRKRTKTNGKKLTKLNLNGLLSYNLYAEVHPTGEEGVFEYKLRTQTDGTDEARSPYGMFDYRIDTNFEFIRKTILENE